jgi:hypothetical protein
MSQTQILSHLGRIEPFPDEPLVELLGILEQVLAELLHALGLELEFSL